MSENPETSSDNLFSKEDDGELCSLEEYYLKQEAYVCLCKIDRSFYSDIFNLYGICRSTEEIKRNLHYIFEKRDYISDSNDEEEEERIESKALEVYKQIHQRYIMTEAGMNQMYERYMRSEFGRCPCYRCQWTPLLPTALSDKPNSDSVKLFCPCCKEVYNIDYPFNMVDGVFFGKSFAGLFFLNFKICPSSLPKYEPSIFGFKIHESSPYYLCSKPKDEEQD